MGRNTVTKRANAATKRYGSTTKGNGGGHKRRASKTTVKPGKIGGSYGIKVKRTF